MTAVKCLGQLQHENLVKLIEYCSESKNRMLVYEFMPKRILENHLFKRGVQPMAWCTRMQIAIDFVRGLTFLHSLNANIIYRDLKASNILIDSARKKGHHHLIFIFHVMVMLNLWSLIVTQMRLHRRHLANFSLEDNFKHQFLKKLSVMWKNWKSEVKTSYYSMHETDVDRLANCPDLVEKDQRPTLVHYWSSSSVKEMNLKNASNRGNQKVPHRTGKKSYAVVRNEMQMENGEDPTD